MFFYRDMFFYWSHVVPPPIEITVAMMKTQKTFNDGVSFWDKGYRMFYN